MPRPRTCVILLYLLLPGVLAAQVVITEFLASNDLVLADVDGDYPDWIELHNAGPVTVDLGGHYLTDDPGLPSKWRLPSPTPLAPGGYLVVFASDKDRAVSGQELHTSFKLTPAGEYLALVDPIGVTLDEITPAFPPQVTDVSWGRSYEPGLTPTLGYFMTPTPGAPNGPAGAAVLRVAHSPASPGDLDNIVVEAEIRAPTGRSVTGAQLHYRVQFGPEMLAVLVDDGSGSDQVALDGIWTGTISAGASAPGQMVRWRVTATDSGPGAQARLPLYLSPTNSPRYFGAMISDPGVVSALPVYHWFVEYPSAAETATGTRCSVWFNSEFYDNVYVRVRGHTSRSWPKKSLKFDFNKGNHFRFNPFEGRVEEINMNSTWSDKAFIRQVLSWETYRDAGAAGSLSEPWRMQRNGMFYSVACFVEQPDEELLERNGLDPRGALYKMFNQLTSGTSGVEKKTRLFEGNADLISLVSSVTQSGTALEHYLFDNIDVPAVANYLAATCVMHDNDHVAKNYYVYRDSEGDGEWRFLPWDKDLTFGRNYTTWGGVLNDTMWADRPIQSHPLFGDQQHQKIDNLWNRLIDACYRTPRIVQITMRRLRTLMDEQLQPPGTPPASLRYETRIQQLVADMTPDVAMDQALWGVPTWGSPSLNFAAAIAQMQNDYLAVRRPYLYLSEGPTGTGLIPDSQGAVVVRFGAIEDSPASGNQAEEFIEILNQTATAVDLSWWELEGGVTFTFEPGTVIPAQDRLFVSPDLPTFRARSVSPHGNEGHLVVGPYVGDLLPLEGLVLRDAAGVIADEIPGITCGDCDGDQTISILDALAGAQHASGITVLPEPEYTACNVNGTPGGSTVPGTTVDILDALQVARFAAGLVASLPCSP